MNRLNIAGILRTCAEKVVLARDDKHIKEIIRIMKVDLKDEMEGERDGNKNRPLVGGGNHISQHTRQGKQASKGVNPKD